MIAFLIWFTVGLAVMKVVLLVWLIWDAFKNER